LDGDFAAVGPPENAIRLKRMLAAHQGVFIASPEYTASVTPLLKNTIDWLTRVREGDEPAYAAFKSRVFALGCAVPAVAGGVRALMALRQILELGCGALVLPEQLNIGRADEAFDEMDNLKDQELMIGLKDMVRRLIELSSTMPRTMQ
jgi:NAD(P)H-dependent FMN reductase